jgi:hypothetical protein
MTERLAYTAGGIALAGNASRRCIPAGACWIDRDATASGQWTVRWNEGGVDHRTQLSGEALRSYVLGCLVQYA